MRYRRVALLLIAVTAQVVALEPAAHASLDLAAAPAASGGTAARAAAASDDRDAAALTPVVPSPDDDALLDVDPTDPQIGRVEVPSSPMGATRLPQRSDTAGRAAPLGAPEATTAALAFKTSRYRLYDLPDTSLPYVSLSAPRVDTQPHDSAGVRKKLLKGRTYDQPVL